MTTATNEPGTKRIVLDARTALDLMEPNPVSIPANATVHEAAAFLTARGFQAAPVIDETGQPIGVLSQRDIVAHERNSTSGNAEFPARAEGNRQPARIVQTDVVDGDPTQVRDIMTPAVFSVAPQTPAWEVIEAMLAEKVHRLFVVGVDGVLIGTISTMDILRHLRLDSGR